MFTPPFRSRVNVERAGARSGNAEERFMRRFSAACLACIVHTAMFSVAKQVAAATRSPSRGIAPPARRVLGRADWMPLAVAHAAEVASALGNDPSSPAAAAPRDQVGAPRGRSGGRDPRFAYDRSDPVLNFVFEYYHFKPSLLGMWTPGPHLALGGVEPHDYGSILPPARFASPHAPGSGDDAVVFAPRSAPARQLVAMRGALDVLRASAGREPHLLCHGLHEWAMLYHPASAAAAGAPAPERKQSASLRVTQAELNSAVEALPLRCTHYDAFRFFTPPARPLNREGELSRARQLELEQPGCVHATMDLFKWTLKALPFVDAALVPATLRLALKARVLDMRASPYDLSGWVVGRDAAAAAPPPPSECARSRSRELPPLSLADLSPIRVETREGRELYRAHQAALYEESVPVRARLIAQFDAFFEELRASEPGNGGRDDVRDDEH